MIGSPGFITVATVMFFGLGFLLAMLLMLAFMPAVHYRAVRLERRKGSVVPQSLEEMQREKERLRADFAMSTRKLEHDIEQMQYKTAAHFTDLARKADTIAQLKETLDARDTLIADLQTQNARVAADAGGELHALKVEIVAKMQALHEANQRITALMAEISTLTAALDRRIRVYDTQQHEIMALTNQSDVLRVQLEALSRPAQRRPSPAPVPTAKPAQSRAKESRESKEDSDVIRRALEAIQASGQDVGLGNGHSNGWANSNGAVPFGH